MSFATNIKKLQISELLKFNIKKSSILPPSFVNIENAAIKDASNHQTF